MTKLNIRGTPDEVERQAVAKNVLLKLPPEGIEAWIDANVNDIESIQTVLKILARAARLSLEPKTKEE